MRISSRISAGASRSLTRIPLPHYRTDECLGVDGKLDLAKARSAFIGGESEPGYLPFMTEASDDINVYFAVLTFMDLFHDAYKSVVENPNADADDHATRREDERCVEKMDEGKYCIVRMDVRRRSSTVAVRVSVGNPNDVKGKVWAEAKSYASSCLQLWMRIAKQISWIDVTSDEELLEDAKRANREAQMRRESECRLFCPNYCKGHCSPIEPNCQFYKNGRCVEKKED